MTAFLLFVRTFWPYVLAGAIGFVPAWWVQGIRLDSAKGDVATVQRKFDDYKTEQRMLLVEAGEAAEKRRAETIKEWSGKYAKLKNDSDIFKRCVAAGKCGGLRPVPDSARLQLSAPSRVTPASANAVPTAGRGQEDVPEVLKDCAVATLMLNVLQADIEKQMK